MYSVSKRRTAISIAILFVLVVIIVLLLPIFVPGQRFEVVQTARTGSEKVALVADALYDVYPNKSLLKNIVSVLKRCGYRRVDVVLGENVSLELFSELTRYSFIVLRLHGGYSYADHRRVGGLFTGVPWTYKYFDLAKKGYVAKGIPFIPTEHAYVALLPKFFREKLRGTFPPNSTIIAGGCFTALDREIIDAFLDHGLNYYIGWKGKVSLQHMDKALLLLVEKICSGMNPVEAVKEVNKELGPDPITREKIVVVSKS